ncbi:MAG: MFS transporter [Actinobacteria bacterium]|nr:MAG: MFS transporter [Actinomycetota bacterium]
MTTEDAEAAQAQPQPSAQQLDRGITLSYALGSVGTAGFSTVPGLLLAYYLTNSLGVAAGIAALVLLLPKAWDVVFLPLVGSWSDRYLEHHGNRRRFLLAGALLLPPLFALMFAVPAGASTAVATAWVFVAFLGAASAFALFQVPYIATPAEITDSPQARTTLMAWRVGMLSFGILLFGAGSPALRDSFADAATGYLVMGIVVGALIGLGMLACWWGLRRATVRRSPESRPSLRQQFDAARRSTDFTSLLGTFAIQALATSAMLAGIPYFATYILHRPGISDVLFVCLVAPAIIFVPMWAKVARRRGKKRGYQAASVMFMAGALALLAAPMLPLPVVLVLVAACGCGYAGMQMFPLAMLPDTIAADAAARGRAQAGAFTGYWTAGETLGFAIGPSLALAVLSVTGFVSARAGTVAEQPASAVTGVLLAFTVLPVALMLISLLFLRRYGGPPLTEADVPRLPPTTENAPTTEEPT